jgi:hypothetical protein
MADHPAGPRCQQTDASSVVPATAEHAAQTAESCSCKPVAVVPALAEATSDWAVGSCTCFVVAIVCLTVLFQLS